MPRIRSAGSPTRSTTPGQEHLDASYVAGYDAKAQVDPTEDVEILVGHGLGVGTTIVDLGAGTGVFAGGGRGHRRGP